MCWPLILFDYNLPPKTRFHLENIISLGVIPGPRKPHDSDSFLWAFYQELLQLARGVEAFNALALKMFILQAFLILIFGDIPAISLLMLMKGHNGFSPCCACKILGLHIPGVKVTTHYVPLHRAEHPRVLESEDPATIAVYDARNLPQLANSV